MTHQAMNQTGTYVLSANTLNAPNHLSVNHNRLFVCDSGNNRVLIFNSLPIVNNASADVVVGQDNMSEYSNGLTASHIFNPTGVFSINSYLFICDMYNSRVLIFNQIPGSDGASANYVVGAPDMISYSGGISSQQLNWPSHVCSDGIKLIITDQHNHRIVIFKQIPTSNYASADIVIGQPNMSSNQANQGVTPAANTLYFPFRVNTYGGKLFVADTSNNRVLIFDQIPTTNNASANLVIGQQNMFSNSANQGLQPAANTLKEPSDVFYDGKNLFINDQGNNRILIFNQLPTWNNAAADTVIGQPNMIVGQPNQGGTTSAVCLKNNWGIYSSDTFLAVADNDNNRVLFYADSTVIETATTLFSPTMTPTASVTDSITPSRSFTATQTALPIFINTATIHLQANAFFLKFILPKLIQVVVTKQ